MKINILKGEGLDLTDALVVYVQKKADALEKFIDINDGSANCDVTIGKVTHHHKGGEDVYFCELNLHLAGQYLNLKATEADLYAAIDAAKDEMSHRLRHKKGKSKSLIRRGGARVKSFLRGFRK